VSECARRCSRSLAVMVDTLSSGLERYLYIWAPEPPHDFSGNEPHGWLGGRVYRKIDGLDLARSEAREGVSVGKASFTGLRRFQVDCAVHDLNISAF
jgi:hypothetical protein